MTNCYVFVYLVCLGPARPRDIQSPAALRRGFAAFWPGVCLNFQICVETVGDGLGKEMTYMEIQLQELIDQIKNDGVKAAETEAASILESARAEAERIISDAKAEAERMMREAKEQNERTVRAGEDSLRQAGRNLLISFRESAARELNVITGDSVKKALSSDALPQLILTAVENWTKNTEAEDISVLIGSKELASIETELLAGLKERMCTGVTLKANDSFGEGFRISVQDGQAYYDYSAEAVTELLSAYLTPKLISLMKEAENV